MRFCGMEFEKRELLSRIGNINQIAGVRRCVLDDGKGRGIRAADFSTGTGFSFTVLFDRGMDIGQTSFCGIPLSFLSSVGYASPYLYEEPQAGFLRSFAGGMLTGCGLTYMGGPCVDQGEALGLHGRLTSIPADEVCSSGRWSGDDYIMSAFGVVRQSRFDGENITLSRTVCAVAGESRLTVRDIIENCGYESQPLMLLYHCNFGWPFVSENSRLIHSPHISVTAKNEAALAGLGCYADFCTPEPGFAPQVFYHRFEPDAQGRAFAALQNQKLGLEAYIRYDTEHLPVFVEWKHLSPGGYVCGLEPSTWYGHGRNAARERGELKMLEAGQSISIDIEIGINPL